VKSVAQKMSFDPRNILVIDFGQLGDVVMSLPALRAIRGRFPNAQITIAVGKPGKELLNLSGYANEIIEVDRVALRDGPTLIFRVPRGFVVVRLHEVSRVLKELRQQEQAHRRH
jgi:ADP-heptose:LPS heptosyltransferase